MSSAAYGYGTDDPEDGPTVGGTSPEGEVEGVLWEPDEETGVGRLRYEFWSEQVRVLYHLNQPREERFRLNRLYHDLTGEYIESDLPEDGYDIVGALGGYRAGKSVTGARWTIKSALRVPSSRWLVMGQDFAKAKKTTYKVLYQQLPGDRTHILTSNYNGVEESPIVQDFNRQDMVVTLVNDAQIVLGSADDPGRHAGDEFYGAWLDEPSLYGEDLFDIKQMIGSRLSAGPPAVQLWTFTGNGYNTCYDIMERRVDSRGDEETDLNDNIRVIRLSNQRNPFITDETKRKLRRQFAGTHLEEQGLYGGYAATQGLVYAGFRRSDHVIPASEAREVVEESFRLYGYDAGWSDPRTVLELGRTPYGQIVVLDEFYESATHVEKATKWLRGNLPGGDLKPKGVMWSEHEPSDIRKFRKAGYRAVEADKSLDPGISAVRRRLGTDSTGRVGLLVADECTNLISELQTYKEEDVGGANADDHALDALRYAIFGYDEKTVEDSGSSSVEKT
jgi:phage terminase large subunit